MPRRIDSPDFLLKLPYIKDMMGTMHDFPGEENPLEQFDAAVNLLRDIFGKDNDPEIMPEDSASEETPEEK